jgi:hypothetical protein
MENPPPKKENPPNARGKARELAAWLAREAPDRIGDHEWDELRTLLAPISENYLRKLLRDSGAPLDPLIEGVRQETLDALEASLAGFLQEYEQGDRDRRRSVRQAVISAKDHARWASRKKETEAEKQEMILWMTTWLENPPLFPEWVRLRRGALGEQI